MKLNTKIIIYHRYEGELERGAHGFFIAFPQNHWETCDRIKELKGSSLLSWESIFKRCNFTPSSPVYTQCAFPEFEKLSDLKCFIECLNQPNNFINLLEVTDFYV